MLFVCVHLDRFFLIFTNAECLRMPFYRFFYLKVCLLTGTETATSHEFQKSQHTELILYNSLYHCTDIAKSHDREKSGTKDKMKS